MRLRGCYTVIDALNSSFMPGVFQELDLCNPATFRDMSKPMGAQTPDRLKHFKKRFQDWDDPQGMNCKLLSYK